jgi:hypothetical protein
VIQFGRLFSNRCQRDHLGHYLTGLLVGHRKTVAGMSREFAFASDQSCLNRFLTEVDWDEKKLNELRIDWLKDQSMGDSQLRNVKGLTRPMSLVMLAYSIAMRSLGKSGLSDWFSGSNYLLYFSILHKK